MKYAPELSGGGQITPLHHHSTTTPPLLHHSTGGLLKLTQQDRRGESIIGLVLGIRPIESKIKG